MKKTILLLSLFILSTGAFAQTRPTPEHVRTFLEATGAANMGMQMMNNMTEMLRKNVPQVPEEFWAEFAKEARPDTLINLVIPVYVKHYTDEEIVQLIEFYKTPLGKKIIEKMPAIAKESFVIGEEWGKKTAEVAVKKLMDKGYLPKE